MKLSARVSLLGAGSVLMTAVALVALAVWQSGRYNTLAQREVDELIDADLDHITQGVYNLVQTENEAVQQQVNYNLNVARHVLANAGETSLAQETVAWTAINQFNNEPAAVLLPKMLVGGRWLGQSTDPAVETAIVDEVERLVGDSTTIFQRLNEQGDMLRVATTVRDAEGRRAIASYIPAINPDGTPNPVIAAVLKGETYRGRAFVVNAWYLTAYEPLRDKAGNLVGMLYVGVRQKSVEARVRQAILQTKVGKTGYVYVLSGTGAERGHYIVSKDGERDGEDIWESKDAGGQYFIQAIVAKALTLKPGAMATDRYRWQNISEPSPRWKVVRLAYYAPWDWVIGTSVYEDELQSFRAVLSGGRARMTRIMGLAGLTITLLIGLLGVMIAWTIARPVQQLTRAAETIIRGDLDQTVEVCSRDEIGLLANTFNFMTARLRQTLEGLRQENLDRKKAETAREAVVAELEAKNAELERFTYTVSHDLKSPLITILGFLGYLDQDMRTGDHERLKADAARIAKAVERMQQLLDELLEISRIGRLTNPPETVSFAELAREAVSAVTGWLTQRGVQVDLAADLPTVYGDRSRLLEVLQNLIDNAAKFMGDQPHPRVEVGTRREGDQTVYYVRDNGMGIEPRYHQKVFGLFEKLDPTAEGTGVGLAIAKRIVEVHGGRIWVESEGRNHGSTFCFTLAGRKEGMNP